MNTAVIDIGSKSTLALVSIHQQTYELGRIITDWGKNADAHGCYQKNDYQRMIQSVCDFIHQIHDLSSEVNIICIGTRALRAANNIQEIILAFKQVTHLDVRILTPQEEAYYEQLAIRSAPCVLAHPHSSFWLIDLGGGSTELSVMNAQHQPESSTSFNFGQHILANAADLSSYYHQINLPRDAEFGVIAGGAITSYAQHYFNLPNYDAHMIESKQILYRPIDDLPRSAQIGAELLQHLQANCPIYVTTRGVRHGILAEALTTL